MTKPHEETLEVRFNGGNTCLTAEGHGIVAYGKLEWLQFFSAAPDMARALAIAEELVNAIQQGHRVDEEFLERAHAAINGARRKAGVIP